MSHTFVQLLHANLAATLRALLLGREPLRDARRAKDVGARQVLRLVEHLGAYRAQPGEMTTAAKGHKNASARPSLTVIRADKACRRAREIRIYQNASSAGVTWMHAEQFE